MFFAKIALSVASYLPMVSNSGKRFDAGMEILLGRTRRDPGLGLNRWRFGFPAMREEIHGLKDSTSSRGISVLPRLKVGIEELWLLLPVLLLTYKSFHLSSSTSGFLVASQDG